MKSQACETPDIRFFWQSVSETSPIDVLQTQLIQLELRNISNKLGLGFHLCLSFLPCFALLVRMLRIVQQGQGSMNLVTQDRQAQAWIHFKYQEIL